MSPEALVALYALGTNKQINGSDQFVTSYQGKDPLAVIEDLYKSTANVELRTKAANFDNVQRALSNAYSTIEQLKHEVSGDVSGKLQTLQTDLQAALDKSKI